MKMQEFVVGAERELSSVLSASVRYVHKQIDRAIEDVGALDAAGQRDLHDRATRASATASEFGVADSTQVLPFPKAVRDYDAVEFALNKRMASNWSGRVSYLWSRLYGNYSGLAQSDENGRNSPNVGRLFDYPLMSFDQAGNSVLGLLPTDRPHQFKAQLIYDFKFGMTTGANWYAASGIPKTREAAFIAPNNFPVQYLGRNSDGRTPFYNQFDLYLQQEIKFGRPVPHGAERERVQPVRPGDRDQLLPDRAAVGSGHRLFGGGLLRRPARRGHAHRGAGTPARSAVPAGQRVPGAARDPSRRGLPVLAVG